MIERSTPLTILRRSPHSGRARVLCIEANEDGTVGGSHQVLFDLATRMDRSRFDPVVLFYEENSFADRLRRGGVEVIPFEAVRARERDVFRSRGRLVRAREAVAAVMRRVGLLRRERIDLVHLNNSPFVGHDDWLPAARLSGVPCVASAMGGTEAGLDPVRRFFSRGFQRVIPVSQFVAGELTRMGMRKERITTVLNGIDAKAYREAAGSLPQEARADLGGGRDDFLVVMVGNIREWKGQHVVLEALATMTERMRVGVRVGFIGDATLDDAQYYSSLKATVVERGLMDNIRFLGRREDVPRLLNAADVAVHASTTPEPFGLVLLEAMALGKPVVASGLGGPLEIITPASGFTFDPTQPDQLAQILGRLKSDPELRRRIGEGSLARAAEFDIEHTVQGIEAVYGDVLAAGFRSATTP